MALHALAQCTSRLLLASQQDDGSFTKDWEIFQGFAGLGMEERFKATDSQYVPLSHSYGFNLINLHRATQINKVEWKQAHTLFVQAFKEPKGSVEQKKLGKILKKALAPEIDASLFDYNPGFLFNLGKMSLSALMP